MATGMFLCGFSASPTVTLETGDTNDPTQKIVGLVEKVFTVTHRSIGVVPVSEPNAIVLGISTCEPGSQLGGTINVMARAHRDQ